MPAEPVIAEIGRAEPPGFYGKIPARGDFLGRRLSRAFIEAWDGWLQQGMLAVKGALGGGWLDIYLTSPLWRFILTPGCCGPRAVAGIVLPSVDSVGRYFPLMVGSELAAVSDVAASLVDADAWFTGIEDLALSALSQGLDPGVFDRPVAIAVAAAPAADAAEIFLASPGRHFVPQSAGELAPVLRGCATHLTAGRTLWWTTGSAHVAPCVVLAAGMPEPAAFPALLDGDFNSRGWQSESGAAASPPSPASDADLAWDRESDPEPAPPGHPAERSATEEAPVVVADAVAHSAAADDVRAEPPPPTEPPAAAAAERAESASPAEPAAMPALAGPVVSGLAWDRDDDQPLAKTEAEPFLAHARSGDAEEAAAPKPRPEPAPAVPSRGGSAEAARSPAPAAGSDVLAWDRE